MLFIIIVAMLLSVVLMLIFSNIKKTIFNILTYISFIMLAFCLYIYYVKVGGFAVKQREIIFGLNSLLSTLIETPISFNDLGALMTLGRMSFPVFLLLSSMTNNFYVRRFAQSKVWIYFLAPLPLIILTVLVFPKNFSTWFAFDFAAQNIIATITNVTIIAYVIASLCLYVIEYKTISLSFSKRHLRSKIISIVLIVVVYSFFAMFEPITVFQNYSSINVKSSFMRIMSSSNTNVWIVIMLCSLIAVVVVFVSTYKFYKFDYDRAKKEMNIKQKVTNATATSTVLIHGLKNQILTSEILCGKLKKEIATVEGEKGETLLELEEEISSINKFILERFNNLYKSFLNVKITLKRVSTESLLELLKEKVLRQTNGNECVSYDFENGTIIADVDLLSEALYNIVVNALDATKDKNPPKITVSLKMLRARTHIEITDNGRGIPKKLKNKIFLPFTTSKNSKTNWGLGLCYALQITKKHMGDIRFDSKEGEGTVFSVILPRYTEEVKKSEL